MRKILFTILSLALAGCGNQYSVANYSNPTVNGSSTIGLPNPDTCKATQMLAIVTDGSSQAPSRDIIADLISAILDPDVPGTLGDIEKVELSLNFAFDRHHQIVSAQSSFRLTITDSRVGEMGPDSLPIEPIEIVHALNSTISGSWDPNERILDLTFEDDYGKIKVLAQEQGDALVGTLSFENTTSWSPEVAPKSGTLGLISLKHCQFQ
jgi:hypothetical protein